MRDTSRAIVWAGPVWYDEAMYMGMGAKNSYTFEQLVHELVQLVRLLLFLSHGFLLWGNTTPWLFTQLEIHSQIRRLHRMVDTTSMSRNVSPNFEPQMSNCR